MHSDSSAEREWRTESPEATEQAAAELVPLLQPDTLILLQGELGAGKTTFVRGLAKALGVQEPIRSPSFALVYEYTIRQPETLRGLPLLHLDLYRLETPQALATLGLDELLERGGVVVIEWAERLENLPYPLPASDVWEVAFAVNPDGARLIRWHRV